LEKKDTARAGSASRTSRSALRDAWLGRSEQTGVIANPVGQGAIALPADRGRLLAGCLAANAY
jgi:hypothetical protein